MSPLTRQTRPNTFWQDALPALTVGWNLAVPIFGGVLLGYFLDKWLGTGYIFTIGLLVLGIFVGFYMLARTIQRLDRQSKEEQEEKKELYKK